MHSQLDLTRQKLVSAETVQRTLESINETLSSQNQQQSSHIAKLEQRVKLLEQMEKTCGQKINETLLGDDQFTSLQSELDDIEFRFSEIRPLLSTGKPSRLESPAPRRPLLKTSSNL